jgi:ribonuclease BN (tRNA processing enzyme)
MRRLLHCGVTIFDLTHIFISHFHPDHTAELVPLLFATKYPDMSSRGRPLHVLGGIGLKRFYNSLQGAYGDWIVLPDGLLAIQEIDTLAGEKLTFSDFSLTARPVDHRPESLAVRIETSTGASMAYSGDTDYCEALSGVAHGVDLFICESAMPDEMKVPGHMTPTSAAQTAAQAKVKHLVLTHLYPPCDNVDITKQAGQKYKGLITVAEDLMVFEFG